jgi:glucan phosphoethanolaminetransferase (alkaline phosphatase superfamily)
MKLWLKEVLILLSVAGGSPAIAQRLASLELDLSLLLYLALFAMLLACLLLAAYVRNGVLRCFYALLFAASAFFLDSFERITSEHLTYDAFINMVNSAGFAGDALQQHWVPTLWSALVALLLLAGIAIPPRPSFRLPGFIAAAPPAGLAALSLLLFVRGGEGARGLPAAFTPLAYSAIFLYETGADGIAPREPVRLRPRRSAAGRDIVLIIDESVAGNYLDINSPGAVRSGLAEPRAGIRIHSYGHAASITNCSVGTNVTLRHGGTRADYQRINASMPSIWSYARRAGLRTVYIDGQRTGGKLHNMMSREELQAIDRFIQFDGVPVRDRDLAAADQLAELINNRTAELVVVNKVGAHFPVHDKYPDAFMRYRPVLPRGGHSEISDTGDRDGFGGRAEDWIRYRNSYRNTLLWNVGGFFDRLFARAKMDRATLIYTSDHGQDLHESGSPGLNTHCSSDPVIQEGVVPLVVIEGQGLNRLDWSRNLASNHNQVSHYAIFPTLLALLGYDEREVRPIYGASLVERLNEPATFNARFNARLGRKPVWVAIDPKRLPKQPEDSRPQER